MAEKAHITPSVLRWARESAKISEDAAAAKVSTRVEKIVEWEAGESLPTIKQAQSLAKLYRRPFAIFFLPEVPRDFHPLQDFRSKNSRPLSTGSIFIIREVQQKQSWISEFNKELNSVSSSFVGRFRITDDPITVAEDILSTLNINPGSYASDNPLKDWILRAESSGIFVSRASFIHTRLKLDSEEFQGFAIADPYAPFVFINSDDWNAPQLFTLVHELAHLWIAESGISNDTSPEMEPADKLHPVELFCNSVAANALMPAGIMKGLSASVFASSDSVFSSARKLGVSSFAFLVQALNLKLIELSVYRNLKRIADLQYQAFLQREEARRAKQKMAESSGGPNYYLLQLDKNSRLFTQTVLDAYRGGFIEPTHASSLLNIQVNRFSKLEDQLYK